MVSKKIKELTSAVTSTSILLVFFFVATLVLSIIVGLSFGTNTFCGDFKQCKCSAEPFGNTITNQFEKFGNDIKTILGIKNPKEGIKQMRKRNKQRKN